MESKQSLRRDGQRGVTTVEYAVMLVLVAIAVLTFGNTLSTAVTGVFQRVATLLTQ
jgi:Flp pilus assembly pilin Flp